MLYRSRLCFFSQIIISNNLRLAGIYSEAEEKLNLVKIEIEEKLRQVPVNLKSGIYVGKYESVMVNVVDHV